MSNSQISVLHLQKQANFSEQYPNFCWHHSFRIFCWFMSNISIVQVVIKTIWRHHQDIDVFLRLWLSKLDTFLLSWLDSFSCHSLALFSVCIVSHVNNIWNFQETKLFLKKWFVVKVLVFLNPLELEMFWCNRAFSKCSKLCKFTFNGRSGQFNKFVCEV